MAESRPTIAATMNVAKRSRRETSAISAARVPITVRVKRTRDLVPLGRRDIGGDRKSDERGHGQRRAVGKLPRETSYWPEPSLRNC